MTIKMTILTHQYNRLHNDKTRQFTDTRKLISILIDIDFIHDVWEFISLFLSCGFAAKHSISFKIIYACKFFLRQLPLKYFMYLLVESLTGNTVLAANTRSKCNIHEFLNNWFNGCKCHDLHLLWDTVFAFIHLPVMFLSTDLPSKWEIRLVIMLPLL